mgnify:CR=1 FL=1
MSRIYYSADARNDFNDWQEEHSGSGIICCICGKEINDDLAVCWMDEYAHEDEGCAYELWINKVKEDIKERIE